MSPAAVVGTATPAAGTTASSSVRACPQSELNSLSGRIVFDNHDDIWSVNANGTGLTRLTHSAWAEFDPTLSPDGRTIAYRSEPHDYPELWVMNADGTGQRQLTPDGGFPTWSPDGSMLAYAPAGGPSGMSWIAIMDADGSGQRRLPHTDGGEYPAWSPDAKRIIFNSNLSGGPLLSIVDVDGSRVVDLSSVGSGHEVDWSPDGQSILFASSRDRTDNYNEIYAMRPDGSGVRRLTATRGETPAWSPDGRHIVYSMGGLFVMRANGSCIGALRLETGGTTFPDWA
jgi:Tol biopolymer transport system component